MFPANHFNGILIIFLFFTAAQSCKDPSHTQVNNLSAAKHVIKELNATEINPGNTTIVIKGATIIDGNGGDPVENGCVIVSNGMITEVGINEKVNTPHGAEIIDAKGMSLLPGFIDAHFHLD